MSGGVLLGEGENSGVLCPRFSRLRFAVVVVDVLLVVSFVSVGRVVVKLICEQVRAFEPDGSLPYRRSYCASVDIELSRKREEKRNPKRRVSPGMWLRDSSLELYWESSYNFARLISFLIFRSHEFERLFKMFLRRLFLRRERIRIKN